jgi:hypothetical protein
MSLVQITVLCLPSRRRTKAGWSDARSLVQIALFCLLVGLFGLSAGAQGLSSRLLPADLEGLDAEVQRIERPFPGVLVVPHSARAVTDDRYARSYHAVCYGYVAEGVQRAGSGTVSGYVRRFAVHASDAETLPLARRVARLLTLLYGEMHTRMRFDHPSHRTLDVWLMPTPGAGQSADAGGEQFRDQIYLYDIFAERRPIEWAREVAHEYGHYALPGVAGFTAPEEWANGYLGERLFWKWLREDLRAARLQPDDIPFVTPEEIDDYAARQIAPLIARITSPDAAVDPDKLPARRDTTGMDNFIGLALAIDSLYGSAALLDAFAYTEPGPGKVVMEAPDFLRGVTASLRADSELTVSPPLDTSGETRATFRFYLPAGNWAATREGSLTAWRLAGGSGPEGGSHLLAPSAGWRRLTLSWTGAAPAHLHLRRTHSP